jgi:hypothetical protein
MNTSEPVTWAERLARIPNGALSVKLSIARTRFYNSKTPFDRARHMAEIDAIKKEMMERGLGVAE